MDAAPLSSDQDGKGEGKGLPAGAPRHSTFPDHEGLIAGSPLLFAVAFNLYHLYPEVAIRVPMLNDGVLHLLALGQAVQDPTDPWLAPVVLGYPLFHHLTGGLVDHPGDGGPRPCEHNQALDGNQIVNRFVCLRYLPGR